LSHNPQRLPGKCDRIRNGAKVARDEGDISTRLRDVGAAMDRDTNATLCKRESIVDAITDKCHSGARSEATYKRSLRKRIHRSMSACRVETKFLRYPFYCCFAVATRNRCANTEFRKRDDRNHRRRTHTINQFD
jgi:hypothetical protein